MRGALRWHLGESRIVKEKQLNNEQQAEMKGELEQKPDQEGWPELVT